ncbi:hypothetical protein CEXT_230721 [Caerostris extrusa]|uniref:Uncharacterized protein n=1 Tax=Caerostris extrusa TaxID=172846 RepID=A0AAV4VZC3_CAEEX|nr:hypothetical protein CEXT_230721 [Caerostris extrusa]
MNTRFSFFIYDGESDMEEVGITLPSSLHGNRRSRIHGLLKVDNLRSEGVEVHGACGGFMSTPSGRKSAYWNAFSGEILELS